MRWGPSTERTSRVKGIGSRQEAPVKGSYIEAGEDPLETRRGWMSSKVSERVGCGGEEDGVVRFKTQLKEVLDAGIDGGSKW